MILVRVHLSDDGQEHGLDRAFVNVISVDFVKLRQEPFDILGKVFFVHISFVLCPLVKINRPDRKRICTVRVCAIFLDNKQLAVINAHTLDFSDRIFHGDL